MKSEAKSQPKPKVEVRSSPRNKKTVTKGDATSLNENDEDIPKKRNSARAKRSVIDDDEDAFMGDDADAGDDIFAADARGRNKRKNDDYVEEDTEEEFLPKPKRIASRAKPADGDDKPVALKPTKRGAASAPAKKRKTPETSSGEEEEEEDDEPQSRKKPAAKKPRAPRTKKADEPETAEIQAILDDIPTVRPPTPPAQDPDAKPKFDWRKAAAGEETLARRQIP